MSDAGYKLRNKTEIHFITFAVLSWVEVFTRKEYRDILLESIRYCQNEKGIGNKIFIKSFRSYKLQ
jgi:hypothetical protein